MSEAADKLRQGAASTTSDGGEVKVCAEQADVSRAEDIAAAVGRAEEEVGEPVSILICCAGLAECKTFEDCEVEDFERLVRVNYLGTVYAVRSCMPSMRRRGSGSIVVVSSQAGQVGLYGYTSYAPSKFALLGFAQVGHAGIPSSFVIGSSVPQLLF